MVLLTPNKEPHCIKNKKPDHHIYSKLDLMIELIKLKVAFMKSNLPTLITPIKKPSRIISTCCVASLFIPTFVDAGGVCIIAKELGNSLAIEWIADSQESVDSAIEKATTKLREQGFSRKKLQDVHVQANTNLTHGYMVIIKTKYKTPYKTTMGDTRTSYGCGFSETSSAEAEQAAVNNLRSYSWGWKGEYGYELHARHQF
jgi:hypothetical protein